MNFYATGPGARYCNECLTRICPVCGKNYIVAMSYRRRTCSLSCGNILAGKNRTGSLRSLESRLNMSKAQIKSRQQNPIWEVLDQKSSERMKQNNPFKREEVKIKMIETKRKNGTLGWLGGRGGNGKITNQQKILADLLPDCVMEYAISLGKRCSGFPTNYKVDIAFPSIRLAVEVDGKGHLVLLKQMQDLKKEKKLKELGWSVFRVTNQAVDLNAKSVVANILKLKMGLQSSMIWKSKTTHRIRLEK